MYEKSIVIRNSSGLHARPASKFIACAKGFNSKITIRRTGGEENVNAKSVIMLLSLGLSQGESVQICAEGEDEVQAVDTLIGLIDSGLGET